MVATSSPRERAARVALCWNCDTVPARHAPIARRSSALSKDVRGGKVRWRPGRSRGRGKPMPISARDESRRNPKSGERFGPAFGLVEDADLAGHADDPFHPPQLEGWFLLDNQPWSAVDQDDVANLSVGTVAVQDPVGDVGPTQDHFEGGHGALLSVGRLVRAD